MLPGLVETVVGRYARLYDRLLPGRLVGLYVVGSTALGAYRPERSDIDVVAVVDRGLTAVELRRLRMVHVLSGSVSGLRAVRHGQYPIPGTCNGAVVRAEDLTKPVTTIVPVAHHCGHAFAVGRAFDVNPVVWTTLARCGIAVRGAAPDTLGLDPEPERLAEWNLRNLDEYWRRWAQAATSPRGALAQRLRPRWPTSWGVLGAPRLHHTIATGDVIAKEAAGEYALEVFAPEWHPIIREGLAYWRGEPALRDFPDAASRRRRAGEFVLHVVDSAHALAEVRT